MAHSAACIRGRFVTQPERRSRLRLNTEVIHLAHSLCSPRGSFRPAGAPTPALTFGGTDRPRTGSLLIPNQARFHLRHCSVLCPLPNPAANPAALADLPFGSAGEKERNPGLQKPLRPARRWRQPFGLNEAEAIPPAAISPPFQGEVLISLSICVILPLSISLTVYLPPQVCGLFYSGIPGKTNRTLFTPSVFFPVFSS